MTNYNSPQALPYLDALLKHQSFTKAAKDMYISQPYLTQFIRKIEDSLGTAIINRDSPQLQLTQAGKIYYNYLETTEKEKNDLLKAISSTNDSQQLDIKIGILSSLATFILPLALPQFLKLCPDSSVTVIEDLPAQNETRALNNEIDFYIGQNPETVSPTLKAIPSGRHHYFAIIPTSSHYYDSTRHYLDKNTIPINDLLSQELILTTGGSAIRRQLSRLFHRYNITPKVKLESDNIYTVSLLAQNDAGIAFVPENVVQSLQTNLPFNLYPISEDLLSVDYFIAYDNNKKLNLAHQTFVDVLIETIKGYKINP